MAKTISLFLIAALLSYVLAACTSPAPTIEATRLTPQTVEVTQTRPPTVTATQTVRATAASPTPTLPTPTFIPTLKPTATVIPARMPVIHDSPGEIYETLFSIPAGDNKIFHYHLPSCCGGIPGPTAIAVLPDDTILISDFPTRRLHHFDRDGHLRQTIRVDNLGLGYVRDLRVAGDEIYLLEAGYQNIRVHRLTFAGELIASEEVPYEFSFDKTDSGLTLEAALTGISIDCEGQIVLEVADGGLLIPLAEAQKLTEIDLITEGLSCNDKRFFVSTSGLFRDAQITAGERIYQTQSSDRFGGLSFLAVLQDGSFYLERDDIMPKSPVKVDKTIHYIDRNGEIRGVARVPLSEFYFYVSRSVAVSPNGEVIALLPRPDSVDVIRLNFYQQLEPLVPEAVFPRITLLPESP